MEEYRKDMHAEADTEVKENTAEETTRKPRWALGKLVLGILSMVLFVMVLFQSCAAGIGNALSENGEAGGSAGFLCALNLLITGIIAVAARKSVKKAPMIVAAVLLWLNLFYAKAMAGSYKDLVIWGYLSFFFGAVYLFSVMHTKKQRIIAAVVTVLLLVIFSVMGNGTAKSASAESSGAPETEKEAGMTYEETASEEIEEQVTEGTEEQQVTEETEQQAAEGTEEQVTEGTEEQQKEERSPADEEQEEAQESGAEQGDTQLDEAQQTAGAAWEVGEGRVIPYKDSIGSLWVQIAVPVLNTGTENLYLSAGTIDLEDEGGHMVDSKSMVSVYPQVIMPGETAWYYEETMLDNEPSSELAAVPHVDVKQAKIDCVRYETSDVTFSDDSYGGVKVTGRVKNTGDEDESFIYVVIFMYDAEDQLIGQTFDILTDELKAGESMGFSTSFSGAGEDLTTEDVASYRIYAYPTQFQF